MYTYQMKPCGHDADSHLGERSHRHVTRKSSGWFARLILECKGAILVPGVCRRPWVVRGGAQKFEIDVCHLSYTSQLVPNVINLDFSFRTCILSPSNSSGVLRSGFETVPERSVCCAEGRWGSFQWSLSRIWALNTAGHSAIWRTPA